MTNKEQVAESLRRQGVEFEETEDRISFRTEHWVIDHYFRPDGSLCGINHGNLASVQKLKLHGEEKT